jgi:hypothetical protein
MACAIENRVITRCVANWNSVIGYVQQDLTSHVLYENNIVVVVRSTIVRPLPFNFVKIATIGVCTLGEEQCSSVGTESRRHRHGIIVDLEEN